MNTVDIVNLTTLLKDAASEIMVAEDQVVVAGISVENAEKRLLRAREKLHGLKARVVDFGKSI